MIVGLWLIVEPHNGTLTLTLVLGIYFLVMGSTRIAVGRGRNLTSTVRCFVIVYYRHKGALVPALLD